MVAPKEDRYSRQRILPQIGHSGQERLGLSRVAVMGCGALGSAQAELLVRAGVGFVRLVDRDVPELSNLQRQHLFDESDVENRTPKALAGAARLQRINSSVEVEGVIADIHAGNVLELLSDVDVVLDGLDNFETRYLLNDACVSLGKPWFYGAVQGTAAYAMPIISGIGPCFRCVFPEAPAAGMVPTCDMSGVLGATVSLAASLQVSDAMRWLVEGSRDPAGYIVRLRQMDLWSGRAFSIAPLRDTSCPCCGASQYPYLGAEEVTRTRALCGRAAVQVSPTHDLNLDLYVLADRIAHYAQATLRNDVLEIVDGSLRMLVFRSGRAIVHGTSDPTEARRMVTKYIG